MVKFLALTFLFISFAPHAFAQNICADRQKLLKSLSQDYKEIPKALGMSNDGNVLELISAKNGDTWTLLLTAPDGVSCVVAAGQLWEQASPQLADTEPET